MSGHLHVLYDRSRRADLARESARRRAATGPRPHRAPVATAGFLCLLAAQANVLTLGIVLPEVASDFGISTAAAGQLRTAAGLAGALAAAAVAFWARSRLYPLLLGGAAMLVVSALASALAPSFSVLALAQLGVGVGTGVLVAGGMAAAATWTAPERRTATLASVALGQPVSWVVCMPLVGVMADIDWRIAWIGAPLVAAVAAVVSVAACRPAAARADARGRRALRWDPRLAGWAVGELLAYAAWAGTLVYAGALMLESYDASASEVGLALALGASAALPGNLLARRWLGDSPRELLAVLGAGAAVLTVAFGAVRPSLAVSTALFALLVLMACTRTVAGSVLATYVGPSRSLATMGVRACIGQLGYLIGAAAGGAALAVGGYALVGVTLATLFALSTLPHLAVLVTAPRSRLAS